MSCDCLLLGVRGNLRFRKTSAMGWLDGASEREVTELIAKSAPVPTCNSSQRIRTQAGANHLGFWEKAIRTADRPMTVDDADFTIVDYCGRVWRSFNSLQVLVVTR